MAAAAILKIEKSPYLSNRLTDRHKNWYGANRANHQNSEILKIQHDGGRHSEKK